MRQSNTWTLAALVLAACSGDDSIETDTDSQKGCPAQETQELVCDLAHAKMDVPMTESDEELARDRVGREKGLVAACFAIAAPEMHCDYMPAENATHCTNTGDQYTDAMEYTVEWKDQDCGVYSGVAYLENPDKPREKLGTLSPLGPGEFRIESESDYGVLVLVQSLSPIGLGVKEGRCLVNLEKKRDADDTSATVSVCQDLD